MTQLGFETLRKKVHTGFSVQLVETCVAIQTGSVK